MRTPEIAEHEPYSRIGLVDLATAGVEDAQHFMTVEVFDPFRLQPATVVSSPAQGGIALALAGQVFKDLGQAQLRGEGGETVVEKTDNPDRRRW